MSNYFSVFPTISQRVGDLDRSIEITNILRRFKFRSSIENELSAFYEYQYQNGDRPDTIAEKYYGNSNYAWIVLLFNNITDPVFGLPLFDENFENYVIGKYGSLAQAQATVHEYRQIVNYDKLRYNSDLGVYEEYRRNDGSKVEKIYLVVDQTTADTLPDLQKEIITKYDYEIEENERKANIRILDKKYLRQVRDEVETILRKR